MELREGRLFILAIGAFAGAIVALPIGYVVAGYGNYQPEQDAVAPLPEHPSVATAEARVRELQGNFDRAMNDLYEPAPPSIDPQAQQTQRQVVEMLELTCRQDGNNCEEAQLLRRHLAE